MSNNEIQGGLHKSVINWFPGHMTKAMRMMEESIKLVDGVLVVLDARAPIATRNVRLEKIAGGKPILYLLNKSDLADEKKTDAFLTAFAGQGAFALACNAARAGAAQKIAAKLSAVLREKRARDEQKGIARPDRLIVCGIPNTGKSTVINALACEKRAVTGDKAGITRGKQWIRCAGFELLDTPGTMPPAFESQELARHLAYIGSINDDILDVQDVALELLREVAESYPAYLTERYGIEDFSLPLGMYEQVCRRRGFMLRGGEFDYERGGKAILDDFRKGRMGRITLEDASGLQRNGR